MPLSSGNDAKWPESGKPPEVLCRCCKQEFVSRTATYGFKHDRFMTYRQAQELGGQVRRGEQGTLIVKYGTITRANPSSVGTRDDEERQIPFLKSYSVFNLLQSTDCPKNSVADLNHSVGRIAWRSSMPLSQGRKRGLFMAVAAPAMYRHST